MAGDPFFILTTPDAIIQLLHLFLYQQCIKFAININQHSSNAQNYYYEISSITNKLHLKLWKPTTN